MHGISNHEALPYIRLCAANKRNSMPPDRATVRCDIFIANSWPAQQRQRPVGDLERVLRGLKTEGVAASDISGSNCVEGHSTGMPVKLTSG